MTLRTAAIFVALALALSAAPSAGQLMAFDATLRPTCTDGLPWTYWLLNQSSATDCDMTAGGAVEVLCCCKDGAVVACTVAGAGTSVLDRKSSATTLNNTAAETTVYSYTIPASTVSATGELRLKLFGEFLNNSGSGRGYTLKVKFGGTTVINYTTGATAVVTSATRRSALVLVTVSATGSTSGQIVTVEHSLASPAAVYGTLTTGVGFSTSSAYNVAQWNSGALTKDMTASQTLEVTVQLSTNLSTLEWKTYAGTLVLLNP